MILCKNDEVIDFSNMTAYRFFNFKNVQATTPNQSHRWNNTVN